MSDELKKHDDLPQDLEQSEEKAERGPWRISNLFNKKDEKQFQQSAKNPDNQDLIDDFENDFEEEDELEEEELNGDVLKEIQVAPILEKVIKDDDEHDDPLEEAYDLELEDEVQTQEHDNRRRGAAGKPKYRLASAKEFFNTEILYRYDLLEDVEKEEIKGRYRIELKGFQGGIWTVDVNEEISVLNRAEEAEVILGMQQKDFLDIINGILNPQLAILSQKIKVVGDVKKAVFFQSVLAPRFD
jgi:putative sterol carrier protein